MPQWVQEGCIEYQSRLRKPYQLDIISIPPVKRIKNSTPISIMQQEGIKLQKYINSIDDNIFLDRVGQLTTTTHLARQLQNNLDVSKNTNFFIGGAEGIDPLLLEKSNKVWSFSNLTFPHPLVRVILCEQIYRAYSINTGHPYHR